MGEGGDTTGSGNGVHRKSRLAVWTLGALAAAVMVMAAAGATLSLTSSGASAAGADKANPARSAKAEQTRANFKRMLTGLRGVVVQMRANPVTAKSLTSTGTNLLPRIAAAQKQVGKLDAAELAQLRASLAEYPKWQQAPSTLSRAVASFRATQRRSAATPTPGSGTFTDDCVSAGDPAAETVAALVANEVQSGLQAAALATPGVIALFPGIDSPFIRPALMVAWGVADAVYLGLAQAVAVAVDCAQTRFGDTQQSVLSEDPKGSGTIVPTSTQFSIDRLIQKAGNTQTKINAVQTTVQTVKTQTDAVDAAVTALNTTLDDITNRVDEVKSDLQTLQTRVDILQNTEVSILKKNDTEITKLGSFQDLQLRIKIEENLAANGSIVPLGVFQLPAAYGGYLEVVRSIVTDTLAKEAAVGNPSAQAARFLDSANAEFASGQYKSAYADYGKAYNFVN